MVIVESTSEESGLVIGILADSVDSVIELRDEDLEDSPAFGMGLRADCLTGLAKIDGEFLPILNIEQVIDIGDRFTFSQESAVAGVDSDTAGQQQEHETGVMAAGSDTVAAAAMLAGDASEPNLADDGNSEKKNEEKTRA